MMASMDSADAYHFRRLMALWFLTWV